MIERIHKFNINLLLIRYEFLSILHGQLVNSVKIVSLLIGNQSSYYRHMHAIDFVI